MIKLTLNPKQSIAGHYLVLGACIFLGMLAIPSNAESENKPRTPEGSWFSTVRYDSDQQERFTTFDLIEGRFYMMDFVRDPAGLVNKLEAAEYPDFAQVKSLPDGWMLARQKTGSLQDDQSVTMSYDKTRDQLTVTDGERKIQLRRAASSSFRTVGNNKIDNYAATPITEDLRTIWIRVIARDSPSFVIPHKFMYQLVIGVEQRFKMTRFTLLPDARGAFGFIMSRRYSGTVSVDDGELNGDDISVFSPSNGGQLKSSSGEKWTITTHYDEKRDELVAIMPLNDDDKYRLLRFFKDGSANREGKGGVKKHER